MISECTFDEIIEKAKRFKYSSMNYIDYEGCKNADVLIVSDELILLQDKHKTPMMLYFSTDNFQLLLDIIKSMQGELRLHFVPREYTPYLEKLGFIEWCEWIDFFNYNLAETAASIRDNYIIEYLYVNECKHASAVSHKCKLQTRGFEGESNKWFEEWLSENKVIVIRKNSIIAGYCCVTVYNEGTTLWIREIAVDPAYQCTGLGKKLMAQAIRYGVENGAVKGFLATDLLNKNAIKLFEKHGFHAKDTAGELQMIRMKAR